MKNQLDKTLSENAHHTYLYEGNSCFYTFDLGCAATLISIGFQLEALDKQNPRKVQFIFKRNDGIEKIVNEYWSDRVEVRARTFFDNVKMLKNRIYSE